MIQICTRLVKITFPDIFLWLYYSHCDSNIYQTPKCLIFIEELDFILHILNVFLVNKYISTCPSFWTVKKPYFCWVVYNTQKTIDRSQHNIKCLLNDDIQRHTFWFSTIMSYFFLFIFKNPFCTVNSTFLPLFSFISFSLRYHHYFSNCFVY